MYSVRVDFRVRSIGPSVGSDRILCKNGKLDRDAVSGSMSGGPKKQRITWRARSPMGRGKVWGNGWRNLAAFFQLTLGFLVVALDAASITRIPGSDHLISHCTFIQPVGGKMIWDI